MAEQFEARGLNGQLTVFPDRIRITRKGVFAFMDHGLKGEKEILIDQISAIQFKRAGFTYGYIQFTIVGGIEFGGGLGGSGKDENTVQFSAGRQQEAFLRAKELIDEYRARLKSPARGSDADELEKLAGLRDKGIITEEEFQAKKRQVLNI